MSGQALSSARSLLETYNTSVLIKLMEPMTKLCLDPRMPTSGTPQNKRISEAGTEGP